jgi:hypothetical protein
MIYLATVFEKTTEVLEARTFDEINDAIIFIESVTGLSYTSTNTNDPHVWTIFTITENGVFSVNLNGGMVKLFHNQTTLDLSKIKYQEEDNTND